MSDAAVIKRLSAKIEALDAELAAMRALTRKVRKELDEIAETNDVMLLKRKKLRELLRGVVARIEAALNKEGE